METIHSFMNNLPPIIARNIIRLEVDTDKKIAVIVLETVAPMSVRNLIGIPIDTRGKYRLNKIILIQNNKFFYAKNRCGETGEFIPTKEEREEIVEILI